MDFTVPLLGGIGMLSNEFSVGDEGKGGSTSAAVVDVDNSLVSSSSSSSLSFSR